MEQKKNLLLCAAVVVLLTLTAAGEILATGDDYCPSSVPACPTGYVTCGKRNCYNVCVAVSPNTTPNIDGSCTFSWDAINVGGTVFKPAYSAIAYQCSENPDPIPDIAAAGANHCGGVGTTPPFNPYKGIFELDSVTVGPFTTNPSSPTSTVAGRLSYTINASCAQRGANDVAFKFGSGSSSSPQLCSGAIEGYGTTNTFQTTTGCQTQDLGNSDCQLTTCFTRGLGNTIIDHTISVTGTSCTVTVPKGPLPAGVTDIPDGTIIKFGTTSCYQVTYQRKTTWIATSPDSVLTCPPHP